MSVQSPTVTAITSTSSAAQIGIGSTVVLTLSTDVPVKVSTVGGTPALIMSNGAKAVYSGLDSDGKPQFTYKVASGDSGTNSLAVTGIDFNGGSISSSSGGTFQNKQDFAVGRRPISVSVGDVNGDGKLDIVTADSTSNSVSVLFGDGNGAFGSKQTFGTGSEPVSVALKDMNSDGKLDIIVANRSSASVSVLFGNGNGTFAQKQDYSTGAGPSSVAVSDLNGDGKLDIVTANASSPDLNFYASVLLGNGDGTFQQATSLKADFSPTSVALGDLNGDGKLDIVIANTGSDNASVLLSNGANGFQPGRLVPTGAGPTSVVLGDVNGDGKLDIVTTNYRDNTASILLGNGDGTFRTAQTLITRLQPYSVALGDVNGDGKLDIVTAENWGVTSSVFLGNGDGTFAAGRFLSAGLQSHSVALADVNGDGMVDIVTASTSNDTAAVLLNFGGLSAASIASATGASTNIAIDATPPVLVSATVDGNSLVLTYSEALDAAHPPATNAFTVRAGGSLVAVNAVAVDGAAKTVTLTLASTVTHGHSVTVSYNDPTTGDDANAIQDQVGNDAVSLSESAVTNTTPLTITSVLIPNAAMKIGDVVTATITVPADADSYTLQSGTVAGYTLGGLTKVNNT
uniref:FG-GAP-like repeat-containing protein n=2 Tax=Aureimonas ureilytica TaxID=401562 RepID=UPI00036793D2